MTAKLLSQQAFAFGDDDGSLAAHTKDTDDQNRSSQDTGVNFILRIIVEETNNKVGIVTPALEYSYDGGGWLDVSGVSTHVFASASGTWTDNDSVTAARVTYSGTFVNGYADSDGVADSNVTLKQEYTELVYCLQIPSTAAYDAKVIQFRVNGLDAYAITPQVTVNYVPPPMVVQDVSHSNALDSPALVRGNPTGFEFVQTNYSADQDTVALTGVTAGNLIVVVTKHNTDSSAASAVSDGTDSFTAGSYTWNGSVGMQFWYLLSSSSGDKTYTVTYPGSAAGKRTGVVEYSYDGNVAFDDDVATPDSGSSTTALSGSVTTTGSEHLYLASSCPDTAQLPSAETIDGISPWYNHYVTDYISIWDIYTTVPDTVTAQNTWAGSTGWNIILIAFKIAGDTLVVSDIGHANTLDPVILTSHQVIGTVNDIQHARTLDPVTLVSHNGLTVAEVSHDNLLDGDLALVPLTPISIDDVSHENALDPVILLSGASLPVADIAHSHDLDPVVLISGNALTVSDLLHDNTLDAVILSAGVDLTVAEITHSNTLDEATLVANNSLTVNDVDHGNVLDGVSVTSHNTLSVDDVQHDHSLDATILAFYAAGSMVAQDIAHSHDLDSPELAFSPPGETLVLSEIAHDHLLDVAVLTSHNAITIADISHAHELDEPVVTFIPLLVMDDILHDNSLDSTVLTHIPPPVSLTVDDAIHQHSLDGMRFGGVVVSFMHDHDDFFIFMV